MGEQSRSSDRMLEQHGPLLLGFVIFTALLIWLVISITQSCGGHFGYPMDDTYIHMAMAKSFSQHGVWGLTRYAFSSTSSSLLFTALLSLVYVIFGPNEWAPLVLNVVFAYALLWCFDFVLRRGHRGAIPRALLVGLVIFGTPLGPETIAGMEHVLQSLLTLAFLFVAVRVLMGSKKSANLLLVLSALVVLARYESLALVFVAGILFLFRGRRWYAVALGAAATVPIALFGLYSVAKGWLPVPNSIVAKASRPAKSQWPYIVHWAEQLWQTPAVAFLGLAGVVALAVLYTKRRSVWNTECLTLILFLGTLILHMEFARVGWFYRYEAYLVVMGVYANGIAVAALSPRLVLTRANWQRYAVYATGVIVLAASFESRAVGSLWLAPHASRNIHEQQYQMGLFLRQSYSGSVVVLNDIGAAGYLSDAKIVDLYGLATIQVARAKIHKEFTRRFRDSLAKAAGAGIAIVYPAMFEEVGGLPAEWIKVGTWQIADNQICWADTVTFFALAPGYRDPLIANLRAFRKKLPRDVRQAGLYTRDAPQ